MTERTVPVKELAPYIGSHVSFTFNDGWEDYDWRFSGILLGLDQPEGFHLIYVSFCNCDEPCDKTASEHGAYALRPNDPVHVSPWGQAMREVEEEADRG
jgi:hypothetical protein